MPQSPAAHPQAPQPQSFPLFMPFTVFLPVTVNVRPSSAPPTTQAHAAGGTTVPNDRASTPGAAPTTEIPPMGASISITFDPNVINMFLSALATGQQPAATPGMPAGFNFEQWLNQMFAQQEPRGPPPTSAKFVQELRPFKTTAEHAAHSCVVCQDNMIPDQDVLQLPCAHLYHSECLLPWLKEHNTCPSCRLELPTDDPDYESQRRRREETKLAAFARLRPAPNPRCELSRCRECHLRGPPHTVTLSCGHCFHAECYFGFVSVRGTGDTSCPHCRAPQPLPGVPSTTTSTSRTPMEQ